MPSVSACSVKRIGLVKTNNWFFAIPSLQAENDFILPLEKEVFIEQLKDIVDKAEDMLSEDTEGERNSDRGSSPKKSEGADVHAAEVSSPL